MTSATSTAGGSAVDDSLFIDDDGGFFLRGSSCDHCGTVIFPAQGSCPRCAGERVRPLALAPEGTLWAFTVQRFPPKPPYLCTQGPFRPYGVGYVDLGHDVLVEGRLTTADIDELDVGRRVRLVKEELHSDDGRTVWTFAFEPLPRGAS